MEILGFFAFVGAGIACWRLVRAKSYAAVCRILGVATLAGYASQLLACCIAGVAFYFGWKSLQTKNEKTLDHRTQLLVTGAAFAVLGIAVAFGWDWLYRKVWEG